MSYSPAYLTDLQKVILFRINFPVYYYRHLVGGRFTEAVFHAVKCTLYTPISLLRRPVEASLYRVTRSGQQLRKRTPGGRTRSIQGDRTSGVAVT